MTDLTTQLEELTPGQIDEIYQDIYTHYAKDPNVDAEHQRHKDLAVQFVRHRTRGLIGAVVGFVHNTTHCPKIGWALCRAGDTFDKRRAIVYAVLRAEPVANYLRAEPETMPSGRIRRAFANVIARTVALWAVQGRSITNGTRTVGNEKGTEDRVSDSDISDAESVELSGKYPLPESIIQEHASVGRCG